MTLLEIAANALTAASILLAGRNSIHTWWTGIVGCALFGVLFHAARLYADVALQLFFIVTSVVGWWRWRGPSTGTATAVSNASSAGTAIAAGAGAVCAVGYGFLLHGFTDAYAPFVDSTVLAFSVVGQLLLMQRRVQSWPFWLLVNTIAVPLYASRGLDLTACLYAAYWVNALVSWRHWQRLAPRGGTAALDAPAGGDIVSRRFGRGLVIGKFSPLHFGHELVIAAALDACDVVVVLSYSSPELPRCDAAAREHWLQQRAPAARAVVLDDARLAALCTARALPIRTLPANSADATVHRAFVAWVLLECLQTTVDAVFTSETYGDGFADALTQRFRGRFPSHEKVAHVCVDQARVRWPVSGTAARRAPGSHRHQMAPEVYVDMVPRLCLLGGESTGKTTLAQALAERLDTAWVPEYGRERWLELGGGVLGPDELLDIARGQVEREVVAAQTARGWLICDTSPLTTLVYGLIDHEQVADPLHRLARRRYDCVFLCDDDIGFTQDGSRRDDAFRRRQQDLTTAWLDREGVAFTRLRGSVDARIEQVLERLGPVAATRQETARHTP